MMLRGAIIGLGNIAVRGHVPAFNAQSLRSKVSIVAVMDIVEGNRSQIMAVLPHATFYSDIDNLLSHENLDFVDICTPPHTHAKYIRACAEKKIHILCEKPLVENFSNAEEVVKTVRAGNVVFVPCHQYKYSPLWKTIQDIIVSGKLGIVTIAQFNVYRLQADTGTAGWNPGWRTNKEQSGGGILVDTGAHYFYLAQYFFGLPKKISSILRTLKHAEYGVEDTALVTLEYPSTLVQINLTWAASQRANSVYIAGTEGSLSYDGSKLLLNSATGTQEIPMPNISDKNQYISWYETLILEFITRIRNKEVSTDLLDEAYHVMKMLNLSTQASDRHEILDYE
jgi:predicted dehydrogenase